MQRQQRRRKKDATRRGSTQTPEGAPRAREIGDVVVVVALAVVVVLAVAVERNVRYPAAPDLAGRC